MRCQASRDAGLDESNLHRLRHGGASAGSLQGLDTDEVQRRGQWLEKRHAARYRKPGSYLRELAKLSGEKVRESRRVENMFLQNFAAMLK